MRMQWIEIQMAVLTPGIIHEYTVDRDMNGSVNTWDHS